MTAYPDVAAAFDRSRAQFEALVVELAQASGEEHSHAQIEGMLQREGRELLRRLQQDHLDLRAAVERRRAGLVGADTVTRTRVEGGHRRVLTTVFGPVTVTRMAYRAPWVSNLHPADGVLNLSAHRYSWGLCRLVAAEAVRGSFTDAGRAVERATGVRLGKRQIEELSRAAAADVEAFYATRRPTPADPGQVLVMQFDGKGITMTPAALRPQTVRAARAAAARQGTHARAVGLGPGQKPGRKRMAEVAVVYDSTPVPRTTADVIDPGPVQAGTPRQRGPVAVDKWLTASVTDDLAEVVAAGFDEARRRDPHRQRTWIALVDGNRSQLAAIKAQAEHHHTQVHIVLDFVHVLEYLWKAARHLFPDLTHPAQQWVHEQAIDILNGNAATVATRLHTATPATATGDKAPTTVCADYLTANLAHLNYHHALAAGWPIATGAVEGACRHLVKDRMDITGARWALATAEAVLRLRALISNGDFDDYWEFHQQQQHQRIHQVRYQRPDQVFTLAA